MKSVTAGRMPRPLAAALLGLVLRPAPGPRARAGEPTGKRAILVTSLALLMGNAGLAEEKASTADKVLAFFQHNVLDRKLVTTQREPRQKDPKTGERFQKIFTRTSWYTDARRTEFGMTIKYRVLIGWKSYRLDDRGEPAGEAHDRESHDTVYELSLASYPGHERLRGIFRSVEGTRNNKPKQAGPSDYDRATAYLSTDDKGREVLRIDLNGLYPEVSEFGPSKTSRLVVFDAFESLWLQDGKLHRSQVWQDFLADPDTLQRGRPVTEDKDAYLDSEEAE